MVALARLSEAAGLDLVTFQDHPYQPAFLDTWTLLSYVAAQTERVSLSGNSTCGLDPAREVAGRSIPRDADVPAERMAPIP